METLGTEYVFEREWMGVWLVLAISLGTIAGVAFAVGEYLEPAGFPLAELGLAIGASFPMAWFCLAQVLMQFGTQGIRRLTLRGWRMTKWNEVTALTTRRGAIQISTHEERFRIDPRFFKSRRALARLLTQNLNPEVVVDARGRGLLLPE